MSDIERGDNAAISNAEQSAAQQAGTDVAVHEPDTAFSPPAGQMESATKATPTHLALTLLQQVREREAFLRSRLRLPHPTPAPLTFWLYLAAITIFAAVMRLWRLGEPHELVFDETYYVKDAYSLSQLGYAGVWGDDPNAAFAAGDTSSLEDNAAFVVHPDVGKWLIAIGIRLFGVESSFGWRISVAVCGIISVWLLGVIAARLFRSTTVALTAAMLLAMDGIHLVETRIALLDGFVMFFALAAFWALLRDRDDSRARLAAIVARNPEVLNDPWGPHLWWRPWLVVAGVLLGLCTGVKWSGLYALAAIGLTAFAWDVAARHAIGCRLWVGAGVFRGGLAAFVNLVPIAIVTYLATWFSWFTHREAYYRTWAQSLREKGADVPRGWLPDALNNLLEYHAAVYRFHVGLHSDHTYQADPRGWLLQLRPTSFYWHTSPASSCGAKSGDCAEAILALGNPAIWWLGAAGLLVVIFGALWRRDWRAWTILAGYGGLYLPWLVYLDRTIFTFYTVAFVPFVCLAWVYGLGVLTGHVRPLAEPQCANAAGRIIRPDSYLHDDVAPSLDEPAVTAAPASTRRDVHPASTQAWQVPALPRTSKIVWGVGVGLVQILFVFFYPIWTAYSVERWFWSAHMWLSSWI